jgi:mono/diheme cytochrome c family protein
LKKIILTLVVVVIVVALGLPIFIYTGSYNVSTINHDNAFINWWFNAGIKRSIVAHAREIKAPDLDNPAKVQEGFSHYNEMCVQCHGAPSKPPGEIAKGLWPQAPDLSKAMSDWTATQLFWITKNGIKFSAMPGWGPTHTDSQIWAMTAFLQKLPKLSASDYRQLETNTVKGSEEHTH